MAVKAIWCRRALLAGAALMLVVAVILAAAVIPLVAADAFPGASPKTAVASFWVEVVFNLLAGTTLLLIGVRRSVSGRLVHVGLGVLAILVLAFALWLLDGALAFAGHGPTMLRTDMLIFVCAAADLGTSALVGVAALASP